MALPLVLGGIAAAGGIAKTIFGAGQARKAQKAIDDYQRQDLENVYEDTRISTLGSDLQKQQQMGLEAMMVDAIQSGGTRALGGLGTLQANSNNAYRQIASDLDRQFVNRENLIAGDNSRIRQMQERREENDLAGLGQQLNVGRQAMFDGIGDIAQGAMSMANSFGGMGQGQQAATGMETSVGSMGSMGYQSSVPNISGAMMPSPTNSAFGYQYYQPNITGAIMPSY